MQKNMHAKIAYLHFLTCLQEFKCSTHFYEKKWRRKIISCQLSVRTKQFMASVCVRLVECKQISARFIRDFMYALSIAINKLRFVITEWCFTLLAYRST